jgi:hypothetical protein
MVKRLFNLDLHISVIKDMQDVCKRVYGDAVDITNWSMSGHNWVFGNPTAETKWVTPRTWEKLNMTMIEQFQKEYDDFLSTFDGFVVTHTPVFAMLYEKYNKPILVVNTCRFDQPFCWSKDKDMNARFIESLTRMVNRGQVKVVSNNMADRDYLYNRTSIQSDIIPSLCLYTNIRHNPTNSDFVVYGNIQHFPRVSNLKPRPSSGYTWADLYQHKGFIHTPYEISTMSIFEQYWAGVPLFFPTKRFYKACIMNGSMYLQSNYRRWGHPYSEEELDWWLDRADFYNSMSFLEYYDSFEEAVRKIQGWEDTNREERMKWLDQKIQDTLQTWKLVLDELFMKPAPL